MTQRRQPSKKRVVISIDNLSQELQDVLEERYPLGVSDNMIRIDKPNGDFFYGVVLEMTDIIYLVKVKVKIDENPNEEIEKEIYKESNDDLKEAEEVIDETSEE